MKMYWDSSTSNLWVIDANHPSPVIYSNHPLRVPDYPIPHGSKGYATMQRLLKLGYELVNEHACKS